MNLVTLLLDTVRKFPDRTAIIQGDETLNFSQLWRNIKDCFYRLKLHGFTKKDKVLIFLPNSIHFITFFYAIIMGGGIAIPLPSYYNTSELKSVIDNCQPVIVITPTGLWKNAGGGNNFTGTILAADGFLPGDYPDSDDYIEPCEPDSLLSVNYTYNGSGAIIGAELTYDNYIHAFQGLVSHLNLKTDDTFLAPLPMAHIFSITLGNMVPILIGSTLIVTDSTYPNTLLTLIAQHQVTILIGVPAVLEFLSRQCEKKKYQFPSLRLIISGSDYLPAGVQHSIREKFNTEVVQGYGLTETMPIICNVPGGPNKPGSLGIPGRDDIFIKIIDTQLNEVKHGEIGEICIKSPTVMREYHKSPFLTHKSFLNEWFRTGDLGYIDEDGFLHFSGLKKNIFNLSGLKVDPGELEAIGRTYPGVKNIQISEKTTEGILPRKTLIASVYPENGACIDAKALENYYKDKVAAYKVPKQFTIIG